MTRISVFPVANSAILSLCRNKFHVVQRDEYDGGVVGVLRDSFEKTGPTWAGRSKCGTTCESVKGNVIHYL